MEVSRPTDPVEIWRSGDNRGANLMAAEIETLRRILRAILDADERGQGQPFAEAMEAAAVHLGVKPRKAG